MTGVSRQSDVVIIGGGIAGLAAAYRLQERGRRPLVLERERRVGGRMTTDRRDGFIIDRGATLLGNRFGRMRRLARRLQLGPAMLPSGFSFGLQDSERVHGFRAGRVDDILASSLLSARGKAAFLQLATDIGLHAGALTHGRSDRSGAIDDCTALDYLRRYGEGGIELYDKMLEPGLRGPVGGHLAEVSRAVLMQTIWNILVWGTWVFEGGTSVLPERLAQEVTVETGVRVERVARTPEGVVIEAVDQEGRGRTFGAAAAIFALPGSLIPKLTTDLPEWLCEPLRRTTYSPMVSVHIATGKRPDTPYPGFSFAAGVCDGVEIELEHLRLPGSCPEGNGLISLYFFPGEAARYPEMEEAELSQAATRLVGRTFPEVRGTVLFTHCVRWQQGIARFPAGRLREMAALRERLKTFDLPFEFCGDYWDGLSSEGALCTGEQAADRLLGRL